MNKGDPSCSGAGRSGMQAKESGQRQNGCFLLCLLRVTLDYAHIAACCGNVLPEGAAMRAITVSYGMPGPILRQGSHGSEVRFRARPNAV
eukprot:220429-Rhodomonas_salina.2